MKLKLSEDIPNIPVFDRSEWFTFLQTKFVE